MKDQLQNYVERLCGGYEPYKLHVIDDEVTMFMMDGEFDPIRVTFDYDGGAYIHPGDYRHVLLSTDQLKFLADMCDEATALMDTMEDA
jgi:hypothetical protein